MNETQRKYAGLTIEQWDGRLVTWLDDDYENERIAIRQCFDHIAELTRELSKARDKILSSQCNQSS